MILSRKRPEAQWEVHEFPLERKLQEFVVKRLRKAPGILVMNVSDRANSGYSDLILNVNGKFVAIELKVGSNKPTALQLDFLKKVRESGGLGGVAWNWGEVKTILRHTGYDVSIWQE